MKVLRSRAPEHVRRDALHVAERKATEGCLPCAEAYLAVAEQNGATAQEIDHTRRRLFVRAGAFAGVGLAASLVDIGSLVAGAAAAPPKDNPLVLLDAASAGRLHRAALGHPDVEQLRSSLGATGPGDLVAFRDRGGSGVFLVETVAPGAMLAYLAGRGHAGAAASQGDTIFAVQGGRVTAHAAATARFRELRTTISSRSLAQTAAELLGPKTAHAACPYCLQLLFACAAGVVTCGAGCGPCCMLGGSACLLAVTCCNS